MFLGGWLERKIGPRLSTLVGGWLMSIGVLLSYFTIKVSFWLLLLTYGLVFGLGIGIAYVGPLSCAMRWLPRWKGVAGGCVVAGFGLGALIFNQVQSYYINPDNLKPESDGYFTDDDLLERVPYVFLILGGTYATMQFIGSMLIVNPPIILQSDEKHKKQPHVENSDGKKESDYWSDGSVTPQIHEFLSDSDTSLEEEGEGEGEEDRDSLLVRQEPKRNSDNGGINSPSEKIQAQTNSLMDGIHPFTVIKSFNFYHLWIMFLLAGFSVSFIASLYKVFGLSFIADDQFLAIVGSASSILNCAGRIVWGFVADRRGFKFSLVVQSAIMTVFLSTFFATSFVGRAMFFVWVCIIFFCVGGYFSVFPTAMALSFGPKYMSINYGLLFTSQISSGIIAAVLFTTLQHLLDWDGTILLVAGISLAGFLITLGFRTIKYY